MRCRCPKIITIVIVYSKACDQKYLRISQTTVNVNFLKSGNFIVVILDISVTTYPLLVLLIILLYNGFQLTIKFAVLRETGDQVDVLEVLHDLVESNNVRMVQ